MGEKRRDAITQGRWILRGTAFLARRFPRQASVVLVFSILSGVIPAVTAWIAKRIVDDLTGRLTAAEPFAGLAPLIMFLAVAAILAVTTAVVSWRLAVAQDWMQRAGAVEIDRILIERTQEIDVLTRESPEFKDRQMLIQMGSGALSTSLFTSAVAIGQSAIRLASFFVILAAFSPGLAALALAVGATHGILEVRYTRRRYFLRRALVKLRRRLGVTRSLLANPFITHEIRRRDTYEHLRDRMLDEGGRVRDEEHALEKHTHLRRAAISTVEVLISFGVYGGLIWRLLEGAVTLGDVMLYRSAFGVVSNGIQSMGRSAAALVESDLQLEHLFEFLEPPEETAAESPPGRPFPPALRDGIDIEALYFRYPNMEKPVFEDFSMKLRPGEITAIVGPNGCGKTTLLKILAGIYPPAAGAVLLEGADLREYDWNNYIDRVYMWGLGSSVHALTVRENIALCRFAERGDTEAVRLAAERAGALGVVEELPDGFETMLTRTLDDGHQLSWGQSVRVILARALFADPRILLLDEPAAGLDQPARLEFLSLLGELKDNRIIVVATHQDFLTDIADRAVRLCPGRCKLSNQFRSRPTEPCRTTSSLKGAKR